MVHGGMIGLGYAYAGVFDGEAYGVVGFRDLQSYMLAVGVFGGVVEYFAQATHQVDSVGMDE